METEGHNAGALTLTPSKPKPSHKSKLPESVNPKVTSPNPMASKSPEIRSATKIFKSAVKKPNPVASPSPRNKIRERKFVVAKKNSKTEKPETLASVDCKCKPNSNSKKCVCVAYDTLRASQDEFSKIGNVIEDEQKENLIENPNLINELDEKLREGESAEASGERVSAQVKRRRDKLLEVARQSVPDTGCGRVLHLVKAFENVLTLTKSKTGAQNEDPNEELEDATMKVPKWELPGLRPKAPVTEFSSPDLFLTPESLGLDSRSSCSSGSEHSKPRLEFFYFFTDLQERDLEFCSLLFRFDSEWVVFFGLVFQTGILVVGGGADEISESSATFRGRGKRRTVKTTPQQPFKLKTEVQEKLSFIERFKLEKEKQQKLAEEEELKRLRKELVPKAQPMPYFDRPFVPKRSEKQPTMAKEPKFYNPQHKEPKFYNPQHKKTHGGH
ncbi:hypothetical protein L1987_34415 [Smallanthus sonchifolius]|uniref:Uncharacterized protein n=1 Tax=Smallanthus sonchifolius TaxID=185202 RepID=A0ACB9HTQ7_9ASTR|nr:hypothetical protein L1987_34415 [Smallanthus sonchifolius]